VIAKVYALFTLHITDWGSRPTVATSSRKEVNDEAINANSTTHGSSSADDESGSEDLEVASTSSLVDRMALDIGPKILDFDSKTFVPWYKRPAVWLGQLALSGVLVCVVFLGLVSARHRETYWAFEVVAQDKSLSSDRATGAGLYDHFADTTFIAYAGPGMNPTLMEFNHAEKNWSNKTVVAMAKEGYDYHDYPRVIMAEDGRLVVVYTNHPETLHVTKADNPHTSTGTWRDRLINEDKATYPCLVKATNGNLYTFYRSTKDIDYRPLHYVKSTDHGETWSDPRIAIDTFGLQVNQDPMNLNEIYADCPRLFPGRDGGPEKFAFGWTMAGGGPGVVQHNNYHKDAHFAYFYPDDDTFASASGENLGSMIDYAVLKKTVVFDSGPLDEKNRFPIDYYFAPSYSGKDGTPILVYNYNRTLLASKWTGVDWETSVAFENAALSLFDLEKIGDESYRLYVAQGDLWILESHDDGHTWKAMHRVIAPEGQVSKVFKIPDSHPDFSLIAHENDWDLYFSDQPEEVNYIGNYKVWIAKAITYNPMSQPRQISTMQDPSTPQLRSVPTPGKSRSGLTISPSASPTLVAAPTLSPTLPPVAAPTVSPTEED
jgi:hypothetical protein